MSNQVEEDETNINVRDRLTDNVLDLSLMNIAQIPVEDIKTLRRATTLDLSNNKITLIESNFTVLTQLTQLDLSKNRITSICDDFGLLTNLRRLDLYNNQITQLPLTFGRLRNLKYLDLKNNPLHPSFKKLVGTCSETNDCLVAASRAVDFMKHVERQVVENRFKEHEQRDEAVRLAEEQQRKDKQKRDKSKRKRKQDISGAPGEPVLEGSSVEGEAENGNSNFQLFLFLWVLFLISLVLGIAVYSTYSQPLFSFWKLVFGQAYKNIREEYIK